MVFGKKEEKEELHKGTTIIKDDVIGKDECEIILHGRWVEGVGCVVEEEERKDGSKLFKEPPLKVIGKRRALKERKEEPIVEKEPFE